MKCPFCDAKVGGKTCEAQCDILAMHLHWAHFDDGMHNFIEWWTGETQPWNPLGGATRRLRAMWCSDFILRMVRDKGIDAVRQAVQAWEIGGS